MSAKSDAYDRTKRTVRECLVAFVLDVEDEGYLEDLLKDLEEDFKDAESSEEETEEEEEKNVFSLVKVSGNRDKRPQFVIGPLCCDKVQCPSDCE